MASNYFFFTDEGKLNTQTNAADAFGPAGVSGAYDQFKITSSHSSSSDVDAYSVCEGKILVQELSTNTGGANDQLNIILKPHDQPLINFPKIRYFIYRGIRKDSLINVNVVKDANPGSTIPSLTTHILTNQANASKDVLGVSLTTANGYLDTDSIEKAFNSTAQELSKVRAGWIIGKFEKNSIGFEIVFDTINYTPTLQQVRVNDNSTAYVKVLTAISTQEDFMKHWNAKEEVLNFLDPAAFWGAFYGSSYLNAYENAGLVQLTVSNLFAKIISKYFNQNKFYIDIRNDINQSINYFKNYGSGATNNQTDVQLAFDKTTSTFVSRNFYASGWPLLIVNCNADLVTLYNSNQSGLVRIKLPTGNQNNPTPLIYLSKVIDGANFPSDFEGKKAFIEATTSTNYTNDFSIAVPCNGTSSQFITSYARILYCKKIQSASFNGGASPGTTIEKSFFAEALFPVLNMSRLLDESGMNSLLFPDEYYIDQLSNGKASDYIGNIGISKDAYDNVTLFVLPRVRNNAPQNATVFRINNDLFVSDPSSSFTKSISAEYKDTVYQQFTRIDLANSGGGTVVTDRLRSKEFGKLFTKANVEDLDYFTFTDTQFAGILSHLRSSSYAYEMSFPVLLGMKELYKGADPSGLDYSQLQPNAWGYHTAAAVVSVNVNPESFVQYPCYGGDGDKLKLNSSYHLPFSVNGKAYQLKDTTIILDPSIGPEDVTLIKSKLILIKGECDEEFSNQEFEEFGDFVKECIGLVWSTTSNTAFKVQATAPATGYKKILANHTAPVLGVNYYVEVQLYTGEIDALPDLADTENYILVKKILSPEKTGRRSQVLEGPYGGRVGTFYIHKDHKFGDRPFNLNGGNTFTAAHEFGHLLGLGDRYTTIGYKEDDTKQGLSQTLNDTTATYLPAGYDAEYATSFNWLYNLMAKSETKVEDSVTDRSLLSGYSSVAISITTKQWDVIVNNIEEAKDPVNEKYFEKRLLLGPKISKKFPEAGERREMFQGSFAGIDFSTNPPRVVSDHWTNAPDSGVMDERIYIDTNVPGNYFNKGALGLFEGSNALDFDRYLRGDEAYITNVLNQASYGNAGVEYAYQSGEHYARLVWKALANRAYILELLIDFAP